jgi:hypothetical protein
LQTELTSRQNDYVRKIKVAQESLLRIINDILDFSKIEAGKLSMESVPFELEEIITDVGGLVSQEAEKKHLEMVYRVDVDAPRHLVGDPFRLRQILSNLLSNAVKFTSEGEILVVVEPISQERRAGDERALLRFSVRDSGIGLSAEQQASLFQSFSQADSSITRKYGGTGLGLAITKKLVELMGGTIGVESELGRGSLFYFSIPFQFEADKEAKQFSPFVNLKGMKSLVVDDNDTARETLKSYLDSFGFQTSVAGTGEEALSIITAQEQENPFRLILLDHCDLPGFFGPLNS